MSDDTQKTILTFDSAMNGLSVGVIASNGYVVSRQVDTQREQASLLIPTIQEVLDEAQIRFNDLDLLACGKGPGSFTGLRIGLTTAKVMATSLMLPLMGLSNLEVMAHHYQVENNAPLLIVLETKRQDFYAQYFTQNGEVMTPLTEPFAADASSIVARAPADDFAVGGDCLTRFQEEAPKDINVLDEWCQPDPILMAQMAFRKYDERALDTGQDIVPVEPLYLRGADISQPKNPPRKLARS